MGHAFLRVCEQSVCAQKVNPTRIRAVVALPLLPHARTGATLRKSAYTARIRRQNFDFTAVVAFTNFLGQSLDSSFSPPHFPPVKIGGRMQV
eukprot:3382628-Prymnesium_polylepis.1